MEDQSILSVAPLKSLDPQYSATLGLADTEGEILGLKDTEGETEIDGDTDGLALETASLIAI